MELKDIELDKLIDINDKLKNTIKDLKNAYCNLKFDRTDIDIDLDDIEDDYGDIDYDMIEATIMDAFNAQMDIVEDCILESKFQVDRLDECLKDLNYLVEDLTLEFYTN